MAWLEPFILLTCIVAGARLGGIALGTIAGLGLVIFVFLLGAPPGGPPGAVLGMIIAVITALAAMQAVGGLDYLVQVAQRLLGHLDEVVEPPDGLHGRECRDDGDDHAEHGAGRSTRRRAQQEYENDEAEARDGPESDTTEPRARDDAREQNEEF